jgi:PAS domain S-box-containing protein
MWDAVTPVIVGGKHMGNLFWGQFFFEDEPIDREFFKAQALRYGFNEDEYLAALDRVPRISREALGTGMAFYLKLSDMLSKLSYSNIKLARSLSERDALLHSLRESEEGLKRAQEIAHLGSWDLDLVSNVLIWSDEVYRIFGLQPQEFGATYEAFLEAVHPDDRAAVDAAYSDSLREGRDTYVIEHRVVRATTGEIRYVLEKCRHFRDETGMIIRSVGMVHDITGRKQTETALKRSMERFELLARSAEELLQAAEPQNVVESICRRVMEYLDCHAFFNFLVDEQAGKLHLNAYAGIPEEEARRIEWLDYGVAVCGCVARDGTRIVAEHILATPEERTELVKSYGINAYCCHPMLGTGGKVLGTLSFGTCSHETFSAEDLSLMKAVADQVAVAMVRMTNELDVLKLSEDMAERNMELESVNKELEAFIYSVSHDLRAPIRHMSSFAKFLVDDYTDRLDDQGRDYLTRIKKGSEKMSQLIEDLLYLSQISRQEISRTNIDMSKLASSIVAELREAGPSRNVEVNIAEGLTAYADQRLIEIALSNLLGNAWKFTSKIENARIEFGANPPLHPSGEGTIYFVRDNGAGFDPEYTEKMFRPFQRLHSEKEFEGTGIGLAIVERVMRRHGGKIWAEGEIGKGATVYFTIE